MVDDSIRRRTKLLFDQYANTTVAFAFAGTDRSEPSADFSIYIHLDRIIIRY